jgi:hypothetical protein
VPCQAFAMKPKPIYLHESTPMTPLERFRSNVAEVDRLVNFDREVLQVALSAVEALHEQLKERFGDERLNGSRALQVIRGIRDNQTVRAKYKTIYNQAVVLLVSHFASALGDVFREAVATRLATQDPGKLMEEEFKLTVSELKEREWNLKGAVPDLLIAKYDFTFQDMGATTRAFQSYTNLSTPRGECMHNIIAAQACRHVIVHTGGRVSERTVRQVAKATPRSIKPVLVVDEMVSFDLAELENVTTSMIQFIEQLTGNTHE